MADKLVIVESPAKARTINRILGSEYIVKASMGHVRDLPERALGVDVKGGSFKPKYVVAKGKQKIIDALRKAAEPCEMIYLAPDPDREGEAIAWHLRELLKNDKSPKTFVRVQYNEITPQAVRRAFENPGEIDMNRVEAQQARRILDRIVGYTVSPMLWRRIKRGLSAGRVQSVALRLLCEREKEIRKFVAEKYWIMGAVVRKRVDPRDPFRIRLVRIDGEKFEVKTAEDAHRIRADLEGRLLHVADIVVGEVSKRPFPPYITSTLQQACSTYCGFAPKRTMDIAQKLYEGVEVGGEHVGLITYMRTDSVVVSHQALEACRGYIRDRFGPDYCPEQPHFYKSRAGAQEAHEAIRPTDIGRTPESLAGVLDSSEMKAYRLIWNRFVASQMAPAVIERRTVKVDAVPGPGQERRYLFQTTASEIKFPGYTRLTGLVLGKKEEGEEEEIEKLPPLATGESLECVEWLEEQKETQPPRRYSEASLIRALEIHGVGRPSTYAQIISTLIQRRYASRDRRIFQPTELGMQVIDLLVATLNELFDVKFTAKMEESLDEIEKGSIAWMKMLDGFYARFQEWMASTKEPPADKGHAQTILDLLGQVTTWEPEVQRNGKTYGDERFFQSVRKQMVNGKRDVTQRQMEALLRLAVRYRSQLPRVEEILKSLDRGSLLENGGMPPMEESTIRKLRILGDLQLNESAAQFVGSLRGQIERGRAPSPAQIRVLDSILGSHRNQIADFEAIRASLALDVQEEDRESGPLLEALKSVRQWNPPISRGRKTFNDEEFYKSLCGHYARRRSLSDRQRAAVKRMVARYHAQIPGYGQLVQEYGIGKKAKEPEQ